MGLSDAWNWITDKAQEATFGDLAKTGVAALSTYASYKDQKAKNELQQAAYDDYMRAAADAGKEAEAAIALNLTPMTVSGVPTTKAEVTDYTAATGLKHGGISSLRRGYAEGPSEVEVMETDEEVITPDYLMKEEGVKIEPQVFYNTGRGDRANALLIWDQMSTPDKSIFDFDFEIFFQDGGWRDMIKGEATSTEDTMMASAPSMGDSQNNAAMQLFNKPYDQLNEMELQMFQEEMSKYMATGGIAGLRKGYNIGDIVTADSEAVVSKIPSQQDDGTEGWGEADMVGTSDYFVPPLKKEPTSLGEVIEISKKIPVPGNPFFIWDTMTKMGVGFSEAIEIVKNKFGGEEVIKEAESIERFKKGGRARYAYGPDVEDVEMMDEEFVGDNELKMEEGVQIGPMAGMGNVMKLFETPYGFDTEAFEDMLIQYEDSGAKGKGIKLYEFAIDFLGIVKKEDPEQPPIYLPKPGEEPQGIMMSYGGGPGIEALRKVKPDVVEKMGFERGGRIGYAMGPGPVMSNTNDGIMDMGGLEKDYRFSGGFVPIGEYEKKDDVPARLSKNEFVFTADAVRAAGGGNINKGAKRMYETMKNLEARPEAKRMTA